MSLCNKDEDQYYRSNEIWRNKIAKFRSGALLEEELIAKNYGKTLYIPTEEQLENKC